MKPVNFIINTKGTKIAERGKEPREQLKGVKSASKQRLLVGRGRGQR